MRIQDLLPIRSSSFRQQLTVAFVCGIFCLSILSAWAISTLSTRIVRERLVAQGLRATETLADQMTLALLYLSAENAEAPASSILAFPDVGGVAIYGVDHALLLSKGEPVPEQLAWPQELEMERETALAWYFVAPVFSRRGPGEDVSPFTAIPQKTELIGFVRLVMRKDTLNTMETGILRINFAVSGGFALVFLLVLLAMTKRLTTPLNRLAKIMGQASAGEKKVRAEISGPKDIVDMEVAFNTMMGVLESREQQLEAARDAALASARENALLSFALNRVREAVYLIDEQARFHYVNEESCRVLGYGRDELLALGVPVVNPDFPVDLWPAHWAELKSRRSLTFEERHQTKDGRLFPVEISANYLEYDGQGYNLALVRDITERKQAEEALRQLNTELEQRVKVRTAELSIAKERAEVANQAKSTFLANMSHELRTPLNAILGYAQILKLQNNLTDKQRQYLEIMRTSGEHLLTLINDILDVGKIEAEKMELEELPFDLPLLLSQVFNIMRIQAEAKDLSFHYEADAMLPENVRGDERKLRQILLNLLSNAVKYTRHGRVSLRVGYDPAVGVLRCEVVDTGKGIAPDKLQTIFEPFVQLADERLVREGTGLGLTITKRLLTMLGGSIEVESEPGRGSTFRFELPLPTSMENEYAEEKARRSVTGYQGERKTILVVDDNIANASMLVTILEPLGFEVATAGNGREAVDLAIEQRPDLVLLDLVMPEMDGLEAAKEMRRSRELNESKIIGVSASVTESRHREEFIAVCDDFVAKPIMVDTLLEKIAVLLRITWTTALPGIAVVPTGTPENEELTLPSPEEMIELHELALRGDMRKIETWARALAESNNRFGHFADKLSTLAGGYKAKAILELIEEQRGEEK